MASNDTLDHAQLELFARDGFVRVDEAFPATIAEEVRTILWRDTGCDPDDPATWHRPVVRLGHYAQAPFREAASTPRLHRAFDQLVGEGRWVPLMGLGTFPVRFPSQEAPGDDGFHVDASFDHERPDFMSWRVNVVSRGRALLMLFLFSDVSSNDAPTRIRVGSHHAIAQQLAPAGEAGLTLRELAEDGWAATAQCTEAYATGPAGTVYLCHPFLVHAAQRHVGTRPRFMAQPPLLPRVPFELRRAAGDYSLVERTIRDALGLSG